MSTNSLKDLLKAIQGDEKAVKARENAETGAGGPSGAYDVDLPPELEYRVEIVDTKVAPAKSSGNPQITLTLEVLEPEQYAGARFQEYYPVKPTTEAATRKIAEIIGSVLIDPSPFGDDTEAYFTAFKGSTIVTTIRKWGDENDRASIRFCTSDRGQALRTNITPQKERKQPGDLRPDINIPKTQEPEAQAPVTAPEEAVQTPAQTTSLPGGVNLPPGLGGRS